MADSFCEEAAELMPQVRRAVAAGDARGLLRPAHTLKGAAACLHAQAAVAAAARLEEMARRGDLAGAEEGLGVLEEAVGQLLRALAACRAAYERWSARADSDLTVYLDAALTALASGFSAAGMSLAEERLDEVARPGKTG